MKKNEFMSICLWKSPRPKKRYKSNLDAEIESITKTAFKESDEKKKMLLLKKLNGIGIPTASSILTVVFPEKYGIIDIRCLDALQIIGKNIKKTISVNNWIKYTNIIRTIAEDNKLTPRNIDQALFAIHKEKLDSKDFENLYKANLKQGLINAELFFNFVSKPRRSCVFPALRLTLS
jgi:hypothetical protein